MGKNSQSQSSVSRNIYGKTTTSNPYAIAKTDNSGTVANFQKGNALETIYNYVNNNMNSLLDNYLNPSLNSATNQAKLNSYTNALESTTQQNLENSIINPLSKRNMIRSSQATDLYKNLSDKNSGSLDDYINSLISDSQNNSAQMLNNLLQAYMQGYNVLSNMQNQSLQTSAGNSTRTNIATSTGGDKTKAIIAAAIQAALTA